MAASLPFEQLERMIEEKTFYRVLIVEYLKEQKPIIFGHGFHFTKDEFILEIIFLKELAIPQIVNTNMGIGDAYNIFAPKNKRNELPRWIMHKLPGDVWQFQFFINSKHDETALANKDFEKMIRGLIFYFFYFSEFR